jgi:hypothetical protein
MAVALADDGYCFASCVKLDINAAPLVQGASYTITVDPASSMVEDTSGVEMDAIRNSANFNARDFTISYAYSTGTNSVTLAFNQNVDAVTGSIARNYSISSPGSLSVTGASVISIVFDVPFSSLCILSLL